MKKLVCLSPSAISYVEIVAMEIISKNAKNGNFSKALEKIIKEHKQANGR